MHSGNARLLLGGLMAFSLAALTTAAWAGCRPVNGHSVTQVIPPPECGSPVGFCTRGKVIGGLQGGLELTAASLVPAGDATILAVSFFTGQSVIQARNGDVLVGTDAGAIDLASGKATTLITWTGGTGQFDGASGQIRVSADLDLATGTVVSDYRGELCTP